MLFSGGYSGLDVKDRAPVDVPFHEAYEYKSFYKGLGCIRESFNVWSRACGGKLEFRCSRTIRRNHC